MWNCDSDWCGHMEVRLSSSPHTPHLYLLAFPIISALTRSSSFKLQQMWSTCLLWLKHACIRRRALLFPSTKSALHQCHSTMWCGWLGSCTANPSIFMPAPGSAQWWALDDRHSNRAAGFIYRHAFSASPFKSSRGQLPQPDRRQMKTQKLSSGFSSCTFSFIF